MQCGLQLSHNFVPIIDLPQFLILQIISIKQLVATISLYPSVYQPGEFSGTGNIEMVHCPGAGNVEHLPAGFGFIACFAGKWHNHVVKFEAFGQFTIRCR